MEDVHLHRAAQLALPDAQLSFAPLDRAAGRVEEEQSYPAARLGEPDQSAAGEVLHEEVEADPDGVHPPCASEQVLGRQLPLEPHPVRVHGDHIGVAVSNEVLDRVHGQPVRRAGADPAPEHVQQPGGRPFGLGQDGFVEGTVAGYDVARDFQLVQRQFHIAPLVEVRLEARPVLEHQFP